MSEGEAGASEAKETAYEIYEAGFSDGREFPMMDTVKAFEQWWAEWSKE